MSLFRKKKPVIPAAEAEPPTDESEADFCERVRAKLGERDYARLISVVLKSHAASGGDERRGTGGGRTGSFANRSRLDTIGVSCFPRS